MLDRFNNSSISLNVVKDIFLTKIFKYYLASPEKCTNIMNQRESKKLILDFFK